jgi:hypothetical protein
MLGKPLTALEWADIVALAQNKISESTSLEFKAAPIPDTLEIARDVCAIANGGGGDIILGVPEINGIAQTPAPFPNGEREGNRVVQVVIAGVSPPLTGIHTRHIGPTAGGGDVVVVRVPRSRLPAMVHFQNRTEFWVRRDRQKTQMTHAEIMDRVRTGLQDAREVEAFLEDRSSQFLKRVQGFGLLLAVTPTSPAGTVQLPIREPYVYAVLTDNRDDRTSLVWGVSARPSLDGLEGEIGEHYTFELHDRGHVEAVHRSGIVDIIRSEIIPPQGNPAINGYLLSTSVAAIVRRARQAYQRSGVYDPYVLTVVIGNSQNTMMPLNRTELGRVFKSAVLKVQAVGYSEDQNDLPARRVLDRLWQAYGYPECTHFDAANRLLPPG